MSAGIYVAIPKEDEDKQQQPFNISDLDGGDFKFFEFNQYKVDRQIEPSNDVPYGFRLYNDYTAPNSANMGPPTTVNSLDDCNSLCRNTPRCTGFTMVDKSCQLKNNVVILERTKNAKIYASGDFGGVELLKSNFAPIISPGSDTLWRINGTIGDVVSNCKQSNKVCGGFTYNSGESYANIYGYGGIVGLDSTQSGGTYVSINNPLNFIKEGNFEYTESADNEFSWTIDPKLTFPFRNGKVELPKKDEDFFSIWQENWDAGADSFNGSNTFIVSGLAQCQNACVTNTWCESFVYSDSAKTCQLRKDRKAQYFPSVCRSQASASICVGSSGPCACPCGCEGAYSERRGTDNNSKTSYIKKQFPIEISCPVSCSQNGKCKMATFDDSRCNLYTTAPDQKNRRLNQKFTSVWNFDNFPR